MSAKKSKAKESQPAEVEQLRAELLAVKNENQALKNELHDETKLAQWKRLMPFIGVPEDMLHIFYEIFQERIRQDAKWGEQHHPDGTGEEFKALADAARIACDKAFKEKRGTWKHILTEEFMEAMAESDETKLTTELIQTKAVATAWLQDIRRRHRGEKAEGQNQAHG